MPSNNVSPQLRARGNVSPSTFIKVYGSADNSCVQAGANEVVIGISQVGTRDAPGLTGASAYAAVDGDNIQIYGLGDVCLLLAGTGGWTRGNLLKSDSAGAGVAVGGEGATQNVGAIALESTAVGEYGRVQIVFLRLDSSSLATQVVVSNGDGTTNLTPATQFLGTTKANASVLLGSFNTTDDATVAPMLGFLKSGHATLGSNTVVASGEILGEITAFGADSVDFEAPAAQIQFVVATTPGAGDMPGRIVFKTTTDGGETLAEVARIQVTTGLTLGVAGTLLGKLTLSGNTAGVVTVNTAATAGDWTLTLPPDDGDAGEQLQTNGSGVTTWEAAGSLREVKYVIETLSQKAHEALERIKGRDVYAFRYREAGRPTTGDYQTVYHGVMAEEYPEVMHHGGRIFSPVSAFGELMLAVKALSEKVDRLEESALA